MSSEARWLSLTGICTRLDVSKTQILTWERKGYLATIGDGRGKRYLDPSQKYADQLKIGQQLHASHYKIPIDLELTPFLTAQEIGKLLSLSPAYTHTMIHRNKVPFTKLGKYYLYSMSAVRDLICKREHGKVDKRCPFLLQTIIDYFLRLKAADDALTPTPEQFAEDDLFEKKIKRMMRMKGEARDKALREWYEKVALAKQFVAVVRKEETVSGSQSHSDAV